MSYRRVLRLRDEAPFLPANVNVESKSKVHIRDLVGEYLAGEGDNWFFTHDVSEARVFDYHADDVAGELDLIQRDLGIVWTATPIDQSLSCEMNILSERD